MNETPLIHTAGHVLAAIDASPYAMSVASHAGWAAARLEAALELLHTLEKPTAAAVDLTGNIALGTQEALLGELAEVDARRATLAQQHGRALLGGLRTHVASEHGVVAEVKQRHGSLVEALLELEPDVRLFVIGKRGEHADLARGHLGSNLERVVRSVHRPVLVAARAFQRPTSFAVAYDGSPTTRRCIEMVCASPLLSGLDSTVVMAGERGPETEAQLAWAEDRLKGAGFSPSMHLESGDAVDVIERQVERTAAGLLVAGAYGHSRIRTLVLGSTTTQLLRRCHVPVLLLR